MKLLNKKVSITKKIYKKFSSPVHNDSNKRRTSTLSTSVKEFFDISIESQPNQFFFHFIFIPLIWIDRNANSLFHFQMKFFEGHPDAKDVNLPTSWFNERSPIPPKIVPTEYDLVILNNDEILPSPLRPLLLAPSVYEQVCETQTPAPFTKANDATYLRVKSLPSPAISSSSPGEQLPKQPSNISQQSSLWADEVAADQSIRSTPETAVPNFAFSGRIRGPTLSHFERIL